MRTVFPSSNITMPKARRYDLSGFAGFLALCVLTACSPSTGASKRYPDYRYRLTVEVDTPEGLKTGSSVIEVSTAVTGKYSIPNPGKVEHRIRGEAVTVDLGKRGVMFALLRSEYSVDWANGVLMSVTKPVSRDEKKAAGLDSDHDPSFDIGMQRTLALTGRHESPRYVDNVLTRADVRNKGGKLPSYYPMMVRFADLADPKSVEKVDSDDLAKSFGAGVKLRRITVERTDDRVTKEIKNKLQWLEGASGSLTEQPRDPTTKKLVPIGQTTLSVQLTDSDFERN